MLRREGAGGLRVGVEHAGVDAVRDEARLDASRLAELAYHLLGYRNGQRGPCERVARGVRSGAYTHEIAIDVVAATAHDARDAQTRRRVRCGAPRRRRVVPKHNVGTAGHARRRLDDRRHVLVVRPREAGLRNRAARPRPEAHVVALDAAIAREERLVGTNMDHAMPTLAQRPHDAGDGACDAARASEAR